jgi:hypothetical protein
MSLLESSEMNNMRVVRKLVVGGLSPIWMATSLLVVGLCIFLSGCKGSETIWSAEARSPDGKMIATGRTVAQSGFGTGYIGTTVQVNWTQGKQHPVEVLELSDGSEVPPDSTSVEMKWLTPTHLELTYRAPRSLDFQAVKCCGNIDITTRNLSSPASSTSALR